MYASSGEHSSDSDELPAPLTEHPMGPARTKVITSCIERLKQTASPSHTGIFITRCYCDGHVGSMIPSLRYNVRFMRQSLSDGASQYLINGNSIV